MRFAFYVGQMMVNQLDARNNASLQITLYLAEMRVRFQLLFAVNLVRRLVSGILHILLHIVQGILEFPNSLAKALHKVWNFLGTKKDQYKDSNHYNFAHSQIAEHIRKI